jgi:hypothetical protein
MLLVAGLLISARRVRTPQQFVRFGLVVGFAALACYFALVQLGPLAESNPQLRILQLDSSVADSDSFVVRANAFEVLQSLPDPCRLTCIVSGHGKGSLQEELRAGFAVRGQSTLDNWYVSLYWDYGLFGLVVVLWLGVVAVRRLWIGVRVSSAGSIGLLLILFSGFFYDAPYLSSGALMMGVFLSMLFTSAEGERGTLMRHG